ncbi:collagen alpha-5 chain [Podospora aff. communis PSN243]|uniref:Collagen alpha-5 chain n=1 Tax=Podospora aff. communis PSN243 TaxID=3040156 RepID=A0AAV9H0U4_9PEZI|nr:collagen alpha-5 chain [Podospora aff. communis PSN243]
MGGTSLFDSVKGKLSRKGSNRSTKSDKSSYSASGRPTTPAPVPASIPASQAPPPSYSEATANPTITVNAPFGNRPSSPSPSGASRISIASLSTPDDPYAFLGTFDTVFVIDDSGSMAGSSWNEVKEVLRQITPICTSHDADGIDVFFLNHKNPKTMVSRDGSRGLGGYPKIRSAHEVESIFKTVRPGGGTPTGTRINNIIRPYLAAYEAAVRNNCDPEDTGIKPINMIVITDGVATDDPESVIVSAARRLDKADAPPYQVGIQFFQVGSERGAAEALQELDDNLGDIAGQLRDIVDTVTWAGRDTRERALSADGILKVVLGAVVRRLDRKRTSGESSRPRHSGRLAPR